MEFDFKRGDTIRMLIKEKDVIVEHVGLILEVKDNKVTARRDSDGSHWDTDLTGRSDNVNGEQFIQLQKVFKPENNYQGQRVSGAIVQINIKEDLNGTYPVLSLTLWKDTKELIKLETPLDVGNEHLYTDFYKEYTF